MLVAVNRECIFAGTLSAAQARANAISVASISTRCSGVGASLQTTVLTASMPQSYHIGVSHIESRSRRGCDRSPMPLLAKPSQLRRRFSVTAGPAPHLAPTSATALPDAHERQAT